MVGIFGVPRDCATYDVEVLGPLIGKKSFGMGWGGALVTR